MKLAILRHLKQTCKILVAIITYILLPNIHSIPNRPLASQKVLVTEQNLEFYSFGKEEEIVLKKYQERSFYVLVLYLAVM